jgi:hypothetical protein
MNLEKLTESAFHFKATFTANEVKAMRAAHTEHINREVRALVEADEHADFKQIPTEYLLFTELDGESMMTIDGLYNAAQILDTFAKRSNGNVKTHIRTANEDYDFINNNAPSRLLLGRLAEVMANQMQEAAYEAAGFTAEVREPLRKLNFDKPESPQADTV